MSATQATLEHQVKGIHWPGPTTILLHLGVWLAIGLLFALQTWSIEIMEGRPADLLTLIGRDFVRWGAWTVASIWVVPLVQHVIRNGITFGAALVILAAAPVATAARTFTAVSVAAYVMPRSAPNGVMDAFTRAMRGRFALDLFIYTAMVSLGAAWYYHRQSRERLLQADRLQIQLATARLEALEAHIHPHFLFNMLHSVSSLLDSDAKLARRMIVRFGELLRMTLDARDTPLVPLSWEVAFIERYLEIQRIRFSDRLQADVNIAVDARQALVPRLLLQPLVENAIRHAVERSPAPVAVQILGARRESSLVLSVNDSGPGITDGAADSEGIGLRTTRARLREAYGGNATLVVANRSGSGLSVTVTIPWSE